MAFTAACRLDAGRLDHGGVEIAAAAPEAASEALLPRTRPRRILPAAGDGQYHGVTMPSVRSQPPKPHRRRVGSSQTAFGPAPKTSGKNVGNLPAITFHHPIRLSSTWDCNGVINAPLKDGGDVGGSGGARSEVGFQCPPLLVVKIASPFFLRLGSKCWHDLFCQPECRTQRSKWRGPESHTFKLISASQSMPRVSYKA